MGNPETDLLNTLSFAMKATALQKKKTESKATKPFWNFWINT